jgi:hypothetical protein
MWYCEKVRKQLLKKDMLSFIHSLEKGGKGGFEKRWRNASIQ